jgi:microcystin-dependent protein
MSEPFLGELRIVSFNFAPKGWAFCNGTLLPINQNQALFSLLGTTYGGDGRVNFGLPNLQGRTPLHFGGGFLLGQSGGEQSHTLAVQELPIHSHVATASSNAADTASPNGTYWATAGSNVYSSTGNASMGAGTSGSLGNGQPHDNMSPYLVLTFVIALQGIFPSRN